MLFKSNYPHWGWNLSLLATIFIVLLMKLRSPGEWKNQLGIEINLSDIILFFATTTIILFVAYFLVAYAATLNDFSYKPQLLFFKVYCGTDCPFSVFFANYLYYIPETFNEEMIIGAMFLFGLEKNLKLNKTVIALMVAFIFSFMHQVLYKFSPVQPGILLTANTLLTLFFVGILRNVLILKTRKITYSWAIHLSFNLIFFPGYFINEANGNLASEPEKFNITFGTWPMFIITLILAIVSILWLNNKSVNS